MFKNFAEANVYKVIVDLFLAGGETTGTSLDWSLLYMITYPEIQSKCQDEIDHVCRKHISRSKKNNLIGRYTSIRVSDDMTETYNVKKLLNNRFNCLIIQIGCWKKQTCWSGGQRKNAISGGHTFGNPKNGKYL